MKDPTDLYMDSNGNENRSSQRFNDLLGKTKDEIDHFDNFYNSHQSDAHSGSYYENDSLELDFEYDDSDSYVNEISELYSYTEGPEFLLNFNAFEELTKSFGITSSWHCLSREIQYDIILRLLDHLEISDRMLRMRAVRAVLYISQGCWKEITEKEDQVQSAMKNNSMLYECGMFEAFVQLLRMEVENISAATSALKKPSVNLADSTDIRGILSVLYSIVEAMRMDLPLDDQDAKQKKQIFRQELSNPIGEELTAITLLGMVLKFCSGSAPHFPMKKVLLLLWKVILFTLGGSKELSRLKATYRAENNLPVCTEDIIEITKNMRPASPPTGANDLLEAQNPKRNSRPFRWSLKKQPSLDDNYGLDLGNNEPDQVDEDSSGIDEGERNLERPPQIIPLSPTTHISFPSKALPWASKVRLKDIDNFLNNARRKFVGYTLYGDRTSLAGLPLPLHEAVRILNRHVYQSLSEVQVKKEEEIYLHPFTRGEKEVHQTATEALYVAMLPNLPQYMIALLKILLAAAPTSKVKTDSINVMADVLPEEMPMSVVESMKLGIDVNRHKEILVKAVSGILLLLQKHFKVNHVYQFEFMSQHLVFANCIPLVLKFFNQNPLTYVGANHSIVVLDFPRCVLEEPPELTSEILETVLEHSAYCWRNVFSCINLMRILNKLTKWKQSRIMMLIVFKSAPILKRTLKIKHAMLQVYVLKLLKMQTKYLGRQWRKSNMKTISAIYQKVRHRLNDDWAYGNELDARPWDFQAEEYVLRTNVDRFNNRRYNRPAISDPDFEPVDNCISSVLGMDVELTDEFKQHYEVWLQQEVYHNSIDWDQLLLNRQL